MPRFLNTRSEPTYGIAICRRCSRKFPIGELIEDPNTKLMVCKDDLDDLDPYRLPPRETEEATLPYVNPDERLY